MNEIKLLTDKINKIFRLTFYKKIRIQQISENVDEKEKKI